MLRPFTRAEVIKMISTLDVRTKEFTDEDYNYVMNMGYAELATVTHAFYNEEVVALKDYYENDESKITLDITEDVAFIYDLYVTIEGQEDIELFKHGIRKIRDENIVYKDSRAIGRVHIDLANHKEPYPLDNAVIKYAFTPRDTTEVIYIDQPTMLAMRDAFGCALYNRLNDVERESQKRASLQRTALAIVPTYPNDFRVPDDSDVAHEGRISVASIFKGFWYGY
jgi:hypothetical protein